MYKGRVTMKDQVQDLAEADLAALRAAHSESCPGGTRRVPIRHGVVMCAISSSLCAGNSYKYQLYMMKRPCRSYVREWSDSEPGLYGKFTVDNNLAEGRG